MSLQKSDQDTWTVYYKSPSEPQVYTETTTNLARTRARLEAAGYIVIDEVNE